MRLSLMMLSSRRPLPVRGLLVEGRSFHRHTDDWHGKNCGEEVVQNGVLDLVQSIAKASRGFQLGIPEFREETCLSVYIYESSKT